MNMNFNEIYCLLCAKKIPHCLNCDIGNRCKNCQGGYYLTSTDICTKECNINDKRNYVLYDSSKPDLLRCLSCSPECETCELSTNGKVGCLSCLPSKFLVVSNKTCIDSCPPTSIIQNFIPVEMEIDGVNKKICQPCSSITPFCDQCSLDGIPPKAVCKQCIDEYILDENSKNCIMTGNSYGWEEFVSRFGLYYPHFEETGCAESGDNSKYRCLIKNPVTFCKVQDGIMCIECLEAYFLLPESNVCIRCPDDCFNCFGNFANWKDNLVCTDRDNNFVASYFLARTGPKSEYKSCPSNCMKCEQEKMCLICREGYIIKFDAIQSSRLCVRCELEIEGCKICSYFSFKSTPPTKLLLKDIGLMTNLVQFNMVLRLRGARIVCEICERKYYFSGEGKCEKCFNRIDNCEACISLKDDKTIYDSIQYINAIGKPPDYKVICYSCQNKSPAFDNCIDCPETRNPDEIKPLECQYFGAETNSTFDQRADFNLDTYSIFLNAVDTSVMKATLCPPLSCLHSDDPVCLPVTTIANCIDCNHFPGSSKPICKACKPGFYLNEQTYQCSPCMEGCLDCNYRDLKLICTRCSTDGYSLELIQNLCFNIIINFPQYLESQPTPCLSWGVIHNDMNNDVIIGNQRKSFCLKCLPGSFPSMRTGGCIKCDCIGCFEEIYSYEGMNLTKVIEVALLFTGTRYLDYLDSALKEPLSVSKVLCSECKYLNQTLNYNYSCIDCESNCLRCALNYVTDTAVCLECPRVLFKPNSMELSFSSKFFRNNLYLSPVVFYLYSSILYSNIDYLKDNSIPNSSFKSLQNYINANKYYYPEDGKVCKPCPYGCSSCISTTLLGNDQIMQYKVNCTGCRPGFYMDSIDGLTICRFCPDLESCKTTLRLKYLFNCKSSISSWFLYKGYLMVMDFGDLIYQMDVLNYKSLIDMYHEAYLKELEISIFFPTDFSSDCRYSESEILYQLPLAVNNLSHVLKLEKTFLRLGSYNIYNNEIIISRSLKSTLKLQSSNVTWDLFQFYDIKIENIVFKFEDSKSNGFFRIKFDFSSCFSFSLKNVEFTSSTPGSKISNSNFFIFNLGQVQNFDIINVLFQNIVIKRISDQMILFNLPNARSISIKDVKINKSYFEEAILFSAGKWESNITLVNLTIIDAYLQNFIFFKASLEYPSKQPLIVKNINIDNTNCSGCSVLFFRGFITVSITNFTLVASILKFLFESISMNGLVVFNIIPNITNVKIKNNTFYNYQFFMKNTEYQNQEKSFSILLDLNISNNEINQVSLSFLGAFLISYFPDGDTLDKNWSGLLLENITMNSNTILNITNAAPFISIKQLAYFTVKNLKIDLIVDPNTLCYSGIWKLQEIFVVTFENCSIQDKESPDPFKYIDLRESFLYILNSGSITFTRIEIKRVSFFKSAINIVQTSDYYPEINKVLINNSNFIYNLMIVKEFINSGLFNMESKSLSNGYLIFDQVRFQQNYINRENILYTKSASCIFFNGLWSNIIIESSEFLSNTPNNIYINSYKAYIKNTQFKNMSKQNGRKGFVNPTSLILGGYIEVSANDFVVVESEFVSGWAYSGGAIYITSLKNFTVSISNTRFDKLYALHKGGALLIDVETSDYSEMILKNLIIKDTFAYEEGGFLNIESTFKKTTNFLKFSNVSVDGTVAFTGSFLSSSWLTLFFEDCSWRYNDKSNNFGVLKIRIKLEFIENIDQSSQLDLEYILIGSLIEIYLTELYVKNAVVENINYTGYEEPIFLQAINSNISLYWVKIFKNVFTGNGIINGETSDFLIFFSEFSNITCLDNAGDYFTSPFICTVCDNIILKNIIVDSIICEGCYGGFLYLKNGNSTVLISVSLFTNLDKNHYGGVVYSTNFNVYFEWSNFTNVKSIYNGGVIYSTESNINFKNCNVESSSSENGGALYLEWGHHSIQDSFFYLTTANYDGGSILLSRCNINIAGSSFKDAQSQNFGGALFYEGPAFSGQNLEIFNTSFINMKTIIMGGTLYLKEANVNITEANFKSSSKLDPDEQPLLYGGVIYSEDCDLHLYKSKFFDSISDYGGMIMAVGGKKNKSNLSIKSCEMTVGKAFFSGGGINIKDSNAFIKDSIFKEFFSGLEGGIIYGEGLAKYSRAYSLQIENCSFEYANASQGGGLNVKYVNLIVKSSRFTLLKTEQIPNISRRVLSSSFENRLLQEVNNQSGGGGIFAFQSIMNIINSTFTYCESKNGGAIYFSNMLDDRTIISFCNFFFNKVNFNGGALNFENFWNIIITDTKFFGNEAGQKGGGVYSFSENTDSNEFILERVAFENNSALIGGGMKYYNPFNVYEEKGTVFINNKAWKFGADITSNPKSMRLAVRNYTEGGNLTFSNKTNSSYFNSNEYVIQAFRSGADLNSSLIFYLLDEKGQVITELERPEQYSALINIIGNSSGVNQSYSISSSSTFSQNVQLINNTFVFENLKLQGVPESTATVIIKSPQVIAEGVEQQAKMFEFKIGVYFRECVRGEYKSPLGTCDPCQKGYYSLFIDKICQECPENVKFCEGNILRVEPGFWRRAPESNLIIPCNSKENCIGGIGTGDKLCNNGNIGALCGSCDIYSKHWPEPYTFNGKSCIKCDNKVLNILILVFFSLMQVFFTYTSIQGVLEMSNNETAFRLLRKFYAGGGENLFIYQYNYTAVYIKIFMNYITIFGFIWSFKIEIDTSIFETAEGIGLPLNRFLYSLDCYLITLAELFKGYHIIYVKMIILSLMPMGLLMVFLIFYLMLYTLKLVEVHYKRIIYTAFVFVVVYLQPSIIFYLFKVLSCIKIGDRFYVQADLSLECFTFEHIIYGVAIGVPLAVFWGIIIPFIFIRKLWLIRKQLDLPKFIMLYGFLYSEYKNDKFFWEFIKIYQKFLMIGFLNFFESDPVIKGLLVLLVLSIYYYLLVKANPYKFTKLYVIDIISCGVSFLTILFALLCYQNPYRPFVYFNIAIVAIINIMFSAFCMLEIFNLYLFDIKQKLESFQIFVATKIPFFAKCCVFKIKKYKSLRNWRRLKLAIHNYRKALDKAKTDEPKMNELDPKAIEMMNLTSKKVESNREKVLPLQNADPVYDENTLFIPANKNDDESKIKILGVDDSPEVELKIE